MAFETLSLTTEGPVARITLNRPDRANAMNMPMWLEIREAMRHVDETPAIRVAIIAGAGRHFTAGIDLGMLAGVQQAVQDDCPGRSREKLRRLILDLQDTLTAIERCRKPVIAAIHGACVGGGVDLICACDMRYCTADARFAVKEIDMGMAADVGTLQRLPRLIGDGMARELAYTCRDMDGNEAQANRLVNRCYASPDTLFAAVAELAQTIAAKSPLAIRGTKEMITYARDHSVADGLNYVATWNASMLLSDDLGKAMLSAQTKQRAEFAD